MSGGGSDTHPGLKIGRALARARRERGLSLEEVEEATKIRAAYLRELERGNFDMMPAVYVQGSLKTYANCLHLDGDVLVRELKRWRAAAEEPRDPVGAGPQENDPVDRRAAVIGGAAGSPEDPVEDREAPGSRALPASIYGYLVLGFAALVVLALVAAVLVSTLAWEEEPGVSKVHEPLIARAPEASLVAEEEPDAPPTRQEDARAQDDEDDGPDDSDSRSTSPVARGGGDESAASPTARVRVAPARDASAPRRAQAEPPTARIPPERALAPAPRDSAGTASAPSSSPAAGAPQGGAVQGIDDPGPVQITSTPRDDGFEVRIEVGGENPVQISGHPTGVR
ncbi:MAG TPA: helix-turn-helix domain-containing protein [Rubrobacteraceae bacterium]|nr:helix-turn-helix domain-containing protein [Rubrobacteraceae bacterium]